MIELDLDREYIARQAKEIKKLEAENKSIKKLDLTHRKLLKDHIEINDLLMVENKALKEAFSDGFELAEYASFSEIAGGITKNRVQIREFCDKVFQHYRKAKALEKETK